MKTELKQEIELESSQQLFQFETGATNSIADADHTSKPSNFGSTDNFGVYRNS